MSEVRWALPTSVTMEQLAEGMVLYDTNNEKVHCLTGPASTVLAAIAATTGGVTVDDIAERVELSVPETAAYLGELADIGLVTSWSTGHLMARRSLSKVAAGAAVTLGAWSIMAPTPAAAASYG